MERGPEEIDETVCVICGSQVRLSERSSSIDAENTMCWSCSLARGGRYDAERDIWAVAPEVEDLRAQWIET